MSVPHLDKHGLTTPKVTTEQLVLNGQVVDLENLGGSGSGATSVDDPAFFKSLVRRCELLDDRYYIIWTDGGDIAYMNFADKIVNGTFMFGSCANLRNFTYSLASLTNGSGMFSTCKLNKKSVISIIRSLTDENMLTGTASLALGIDKTFQTDSELSELLATSTVISRGGGTWNLTISWN
jgi:hypothetical protein